MQTPSQSGAGEQAPRYMYVGPTVIGAGLMHGAVYKGGIPKFLDPFFGECRALKQLFVQLDLATGPGKSRAAGPLREYETGRGRAADLSAEVSKWQAEKHRREVLREFPIGTEPAPTAP